MIAAVERAMAQSNGSYMIAVVFYQLSFIMIISELILSYFQTLMQVRVEHQSVSRGFRFGSPKFARIGTTAEVHSFSFADSF